VHPSNWTEAALGEFEDGGTGPLALPASSLAVDHRPGADGTAVGGTRGSPSPAVWIRPALVGPLASAVVMAFPTRSLLKRVPVATVVRVGMEVVLVTALVLVLSTVLGKGSASRGGWPTAASLWQCAPALVNAKPACCGPGCRGDMGKAASHYDEKYFQWQVRARIVGVG